MVESGGFSSDIKIPGRPPLSTGRLAALLLTFKHKFWNKSNPTHFFPHFIAHFTWCNFLLCFINWSLMICSPWSKQTRLYWNHWSLLITTSAFKGNIGECFEEPFKFKSKGHLHISLFASVASLPGFFSFKDKHYFTEWRKSLDGFLLLFPK